MIFWAQASMWIMVSFNERGKTREDSQYKDLKYHSPVLDMLSFISLTSVLFFITGITGLPQIKHLKTTQMHFVEFYGPEVHKIAGLHYFLCLQSHKAEVKVIGRAAFLSGDSRGECSKVHSSLPPHSSSLHLSAPPREMYLFLSAHKISLSLSKWSRISSL